MITFHDFRYTYPDQTKPVWPALNLTIDAGDFVLLAGPSGAGKSTLLRCLNGLVPHFSGGTVSGRLVVAGLNPLELGPGPMSRHVGFVFQDPESQFVTDRVEAELAFALENAALPPEEMRIRVEEVLDLLDLAPLRQRRLEHLSGGEKQRVAIAAALALRPQVLVLDEPTSQLDPKSAEDVLTSLVRLNADLGLTIVLAEHRLERVLPFADQLLFLPADDQPPRLGDPQAVLAEVDLGPPLVQLARHFGWHPLPLTIKAGQRFSRRLALPPARMQPPLAPSEPLLTVQNLSFAFGAEPVLRGLDLQLTPGELVVLLGRNGAGKSSLLKCLVGLLTPTRGDVRLHGQSILGRPVAEICRTIGYLPQDPNSLLFADSVDEELQITLRNHGFDPAEAEALPLEPAALLDSLGLAALSAAYPRDLSAGQRQRVALAAILVTKPQVLLLDEPTRGLDYAAKANLAALLRRWRAEGLAMLLVTHDVEFAAQLADRVLVLSQGEIIANDLPQTVLGASPLFAPQVARLFPELGWLTVDQILAIARDHLQLN